MKSGNGIYLTDINDKKYIDAMSSLWNVNVGHGRKELAATAAKQMESLAFNSAFSSFSHEPAIKLAEIIAQLSPENMNAVFFTSVVYEYNVTDFMLYMLYLILHVKS